MKTGNASRFIEEFDQGGRSKPLLVEVETADGHYATVVMKTASRAPSFEPGRLIREVVAARLASRLGFKVPAVYDVQMDEYFLASVDRQFPLLGLRLREHVAIAGPHGFGSEYIAGCNIVMPATSLPDGLINVAGRIFAFDALSLNRDRCIPSVGNPNCLTDGRELYLIDHEQALDEAVLNFGVQPPWTEGSLKDLAQTLQHIFFAALKGAGIDLAGFEQDWREIEGQEYESFLIGIPESWDVQGNLERIRRYFELLQMNLGASFQQVQKVLL